MALPKIVRWGCLLSLVFAALVCVGSRRVATHQTMAHRRAIKFNLWDLVERQNSYRARTGRFARAVTELDSLQLYDSVSVHITSATDSTFSAFGTNMLVPGTRCEITYSVGDSLPSPRCVWPPKPWWDINMHH